MKDDIGNDQQNVHNSGANRTPTSVIVTRLCVALVSLLVPMVIGAPPNITPGISTDFRFTYNITDIYVDRVCRRAPVLLDPSAVQPCRIVDTNCVVDDPCVGRNPVDMMLNMAPCPPVRNPALVCSSGIGAKLECSEKFEIIWKCFLSPNKTDYDLKSQSESCKLKLACGQWFQECPDDFSRLSDVFVNCADVVTEVVSTPVTSIKKAGQLPGVVTETVPTYGTNNKNTVQPTYGPNNKNTVQPTYGTSNKNTVHFPANMPSTTYRSNPDNDTQPPYHVVESTVQNGARAGYVVALATCAGIFFPMCSMLSLYVICKRKQSIRKVSRKRGQKMSYTVTTRTPTEDKHVSMETTPFLVAGHVETGCSAMVISDSKKNPENSETGDVEEETCLDMRNPGIIDKISVTVSKVADIEDTPDISASENKPDKAAEKISDDIQTADAGDIDTKENNLLPLDTDHENIVLESDKPTTDTVPEKDTLPYSNDCPQNNNPYLVDTQETTNNETAPRPKTQTVSNIESENDFEIGVENDKREETSGARIVDEENDKFIPYVDED